MKTNEPTRAWVRMPSGRRLDLLNPSPDDWEDRDLALSLSRTYRWGGHSHPWPCPLSVAQHSLTVLALRRAMSPLPMTHCAALRELLHDGDEMLGFDCITPLKPFLGEAYRKLTKGLARAVHARYSLPPWTPMDYALHKEADKLAAASEAVHVAGWRDHEVRDILKIAAVPLSEDPLHRLYGGTPWEPWTAEIACELFLRELEYLTSQKEQPDEVAASSTPVQKPGAERAQPRADQA